MNQHKGFSLIEVLVSLMLVTSLALALLQQLWQTRLLVNQLELHAKASQFLDHVNESLYVKSDKLPQAPKPFHLSLHKNKQNLILRLHWFKKLRLITRSTIQIGPSK